MKIKPICRCMYIIAAGIFFLTIISFGFVHSVQAATISAEQAEKPATPSQTLIDKLKKIEVLKEKIATKVSEIRTSEKGGITGNIKLVNNDGIILSGINNDITVTFAEDTVYYQATDSGKTEINSKKLKKDDSVSIIGYFESNRTNILAKYIYVNPKIQKYTGKIADIDKSNYTVTVKNPQGNFIVDIETYTKMYTVTKVKGLVKTGFTKLKIGDIIRSFGTPNIKEENRISAKRIIIFSPQTITTPAASSQKETTVSATPTSLP